VAVLQITLSFVRRSDLQSFMATETTQPRKRRRSGRDGPRDEPETTPNSSHGTGHSADAPFHDSEDFIPFAPDSAGEEDEPPTREWDKGKSKGRGRDRDSGRRRDRDSYGDDGYANKKQRTDAASRKAPWVADIDWDDCNNVAEMYVLSHLCRCLF
jgi:hypothetical protein